MTLLRSVAIKGKQKWSQDGEKLGGSVLGCVCLKLLSIFID